MLRRLCLALALWPMLLMPTWSAPTTQSAPPISRDSAAWQAVMDISLTDAGDALPFYAADVLAHWQRPAEADTLRQLLLLMHLRKAAGTTQPLARNIGELMASAPNGLLNIDWPAEQDRALARGVTATPDTALPSHWPADQFSPVPGQPGFWVATPDELHTRRVVGGAVLAVFKLNHTGAVPLVPEKLLLKVQAGGLGGIQDDFLCEANPPAPRLDGSHWLCRNELPKPAFVQALRQAGRLQLSWHSRDANNLVTRLREVTRLAPHTATTPYASLLRRHADCEQQGNCQDSEAPSRSAQRRMEAAKARIAAEKAQFEAKLLAQNIREARQARAAKLRFAGLALAALVGYLLVSRMAGRLAANALVWLGGLAVAGLSARALMQASAGDWSSLFLLCVAVAAVPASMAVAALFGGIDRRFFNRSPS